MRRFEMPREVLALAAVAFCVALGFGVVAPAIPLFAKEFGVSDTAAGAVVSAFALMRLVFSPLGGRLVERLGERTTVVLGLVVVAVSSLLAAFAQSYPQLLVLRGVGGIGSAAFTVAAMSLVLRVAADHMRGRAMSVYQSGFIVGGIVGPAAGGLVLGLSYRAPFVLYAGTLGLAVIVTLVFLAGRRLRPTPPGPEAPTEAPTETPFEAPSEASADPQAAQPTEPIDPAEATDPADPTDPTNPADPTNVPATAPTTIFQGLRFHAYRVALSSNFAVGFAMFGLRATLVPVLIVDGIGVAPFWVGAAFLISSVVQTALMFPAGKIVDTVGRRPAIIGGATASAAGLAMLAIDGGLPIVLVAMALLGAGSAFLGTAPAALVADVSGGTRGRLVAGFSMASDLGSVIGPVAAGFLADHTSYTVAFAVGAAIVAAAGSLALRRTPTLT